MARNRPYRVSPGLQAGLAAVETSGDSLFDAGVVSACLRLCRKKNYSLPPAPTQTTDIRNCNYY